MTKRHFLFALLGAALTVAGCNKTLKPEQMPAEVQSGGLYYTQFSLFEEKNTYRTTNYRKGVLVPINTEIVLEAMSSGDAKIRLLGTGQILTIENVPKYSKDAMPEAFKKIAAPGKVDLSRFNAAEQAAIREGKAIAGMSREAVLAAIGYPPQHETPSLAADSWTYWANRFDRFVVRFNNGKVVEIVN